MEKNWKDLLLKSGLPFEYEVKQNFSKQGCTVYDEYIYSRADENNIQKDFSYDLDANYWRGASIDFMIECKFKTKDTNWFFLPDPFAYLNDIYRDDFFHIGDYFVNPRFAFSRIEVRNKAFIGPLCGKGVEILDNNFIETNIRKAINQISYAFIEKVIEGINEQLQTEMFFDTAFITVPIIITNAKLNIINENVTVKQIQNAKSIEEVSEQRDFLIHRSKIGNDLRNYNLKKLKEYFNNNFDYANKHIRTENIDRLIENLSNMPELILIMHHSDTEDNYSKLFKYIDELMEEKHPEAVKKRQPKPSYINEVENKLKEILDRKNKNSH